MLNRRRLLFGAAAAITVAAGAGVGLIQLAEAGIIPGKGVLDEHLGHCDAEVPPVHATPGEIVAGSFASTLRGTRVNFRVAYPPGFPPGAKLPVCLVLHGFAANEVDALGAGDYPAYLAQVVGAAPTGGAGGAATGLAPFALASVAGGNGYWHPHPGDDPLGMLIHEFLPLLGTRGLMVDHPAVLGYSMGGFGALLCGLTQPGRFAHIEASSPAFWRSYDEANRVNPGAFSSPTDWAQYGNILARAADLDTLPMNIYVGASDDFEPAISALRSRLTNPAAVHISQGCHDERFWQHTAPAQLTQISAALATTSS